MMCQNVRNRCSALASVAIREPKAAAEIFERLVNGRKDQKTVAVLEVRP